MSIKLIFLWLILSIMMGFGTYWFLNWLFNREGPEQTDEERNRELTEISNEFS